MADVIVRMSAEDANTVRAWMEAKRGPEAYQQELDKITAKGRRAGATVKEGFGPQTIGQFVSVAATIGLIHKAIDKTTEAWTAYMKIQKDALASSRAVDEGSRKLAQIAAGDPEKLAALYEQRDRLAVKYGIKDRNKVSDAIFNAQSAGLSDAELEKSLQGTLIGDEAESATRFMGAVKQIYKGKVDPKAAYNVAFQAQAEAANLEMKDVVQGLPELMNPADVLGLSLEQTASIFSETASHYAGGADTATAYKRLLAKLSMRPEYAGKGLEGLEKFVNLPEAQWKDIIGEDTEPRAAARNLKAEFEDIKKTAAKYKAVAAATGTSQDAVGQAVEAQLAQEANRNNLALSQHEIALEVEREQKLAKKEAPRQRQMVIEQQRLLAENEGFTGWAGATAFGGAAEFFGGNDEQIKYWSRFGRRYGRAFQDAPDNAAYVLDKLIPEALKTDQEKVRDRALAERVEKDFKGPEILDELKGLRDDLKNQKPPVVSIERDGAGQPLPAMPGLGDRGDADLARGGRR